MSPPLIIDREQVDFIVGALRASILGCMDDLGRHGHL
jgi:adenosylmethionine-8-amino-7-oxononanoate aminotransferase